MNRRLVLLSVIVGLLSVAPPAFAEFPYARPGADPNDYTDLYLNGEEPNDVGGEEFKYSASPVPGGANSLNDAKPTELGGVRGGHLFDRDDALPTGWQVTTGRPDVTIATLDSGIKWNEYSAMNDLRFKTRVNRGEVPRPRNDGLTTPNERGEDCSGTGPYDAPAGFDLNGDGVFNILDYACDNRVDPAPALGVGPTFPGGHPFAGQPVLDPQDILIAFSDPAFTASSSSSPDGDVAGGDDDDANGYVDDMVGWDFLDNDNDPFDDVQYGHGTGEAEGSTGEANNGSTIGSCANCMVVHMRVGDSFIADVNRFAAAVTYAVDNGVLVVQSALGTLNNSSFSRDAVDYAYDHGVTVVVSAADEAAQHNNQPFLPKTILVNSVTRSLTPPPNQSYLAFNGCTNFNAKITLAIPSTSCSSDAVGVGSGMAGIVVSAAYNALEKGALDEHPTCMLAGDGPDPGTVGPDPCAITPNEVRQVMASGTRGDHTNDVKSFPDDVNFASPPTPVLPTGGPEPSCAAPAPGCTDPNGALQAQVDLNRPPITTGSPGSSYPARRGHDQFYGYGRVNINRSVRTLVDNPETPSDSEVPPEAELDSPTWFEQVDPAQETFEVTGEVFARNGSYSCEVLVAPGHYPNNNRADDTSARGPGDFEPVPAGDGACNGDPLSDAVDGTLAEVTVADLKAQFPPLTDFNGPQPTPNAANGNGRPNADPHGFTVKVIATAERNGITLTGEDRRAAYLHRDADMLEGFPKAIDGEGEIDGPGEMPTADGESSPAFADLDGDNRNELIFADDNGFVHALRPDGSELPNWPVRGDTPPFIAQHSASKGYASDAISTDRGGAILSAVAIGDANRDGAPEVYAADLEGKVYGWDDAGTRIFTEETNIAYSGKPLSPFDNVRYEPAAGGFPAQSEYRRTQHGFIASPVLADLDGNDGGRVEIVAAAMDRHVYAWEASDPNPGAPGGASQLGGYPNLIVDPAKVESVDPTTHAITFKADADSFMQGAIIDTPAVGDLDADADDLGPDERPEIVVGTNEEYDEPINVGNFTTATFPPLSGSGVLSPGNSRLYALGADGNSGSPLLVEPGELFAGDWPFAVGIANTELLPVVGEGVTGYPVIASFSCPFGGAGAKVGVLANNGPAYVLNDDASSCYGDGGSGPNALESDVYATLPPGDEYDKPVLPAVGHPAFGQLTPTPGSMQFLAPAAGINRALDVAAPDYQEGQDFIGVWDAATTSGTPSQFRQNFPQAVNDLQFLTGPSIADIDNLPGEEVVEGTSSKDLVAYNAAGLAVGGWPKLTTDWTVANPLIGSFGTLDTEEGAGKVVVGMTRSGYIHAYATGADACSPSSWPRFHHDNANSGDYSRDAVLPGRPFDASVEGTALEFTAPGDDLLCGTATRYEIVTSDQPISSSNFNDAQPLEGAPPPEEAGTVQTYEIPTAARRYVAIRAVDEQGNVGRPAVFDRGAAAVGPDDPGDGPGPGADGAGDGNGGSDGAGGAGAGGGGGSAGGAGEGGGPCANLIRGTGDRDKLTGGGAGDRIRGLAGRDRLKGGPGNDCVSGQGGADRVSGETGDDLLKGGRGKDRIRGGEGDDVVRARRGARDRINCGPGDDIAYVNAKRDRVRNCERVRTR